MEMFIGQVQSFFTVSRLILLSGGIFSVFIIFLLGNTYKKNYFFFFDRYFIILFWGIILSKILWVIINFQSFANDKWSWSPYEQFQEYLTGNTKLIWFSTLPWKAMTFWDSNIYIIGVFCAFVVYTYYISKKNLTRAYYTLLIVGLGLIPMFFAYLIYLEYEFLYFSEFSFEFGFGNAGIILLGLTGVYIINSILISKKSEDIKRIKSTRNSQNDLVKEVANLARMNKFRVTKRTSDKQVNNPSIPQ